MADEIKSEPEQDPTAGDAMGAGPDAPESADVKAEEPRAAEKPEVVAAEAPADFEDKSDSLGQVFRHYADGRVELQPAASSLRP